MKRPWLTERSAIRSDPALQPLPSPTHSSLLPPPPPSPALPPPPPAQPTAEYDEMEFSVSVRKEDLEEADPNAQQAIEAARAEDAEAEAAKRARAAED